VKELSTKRKCKPSQWSPKARRALGNKDFTRVNRLLDTLEQSVYHCLKKNGSLNERLLMDSRGLQTSLSSKVMPIGEIANQQTANIEKQDNVLNEQIQINITDDVYDEAVYGRNMHCISQGEDSSLT